MNPGHKGVQGLGRCDEGPGPRFEGVWTLDEIPHRSEGTWVRSKDYWVEPTALSASKAKGAISEWSAEKTSLAVQRITERDTFALIRCERKFFSD